jgi:hypothetical protein
MMTNVSSLPEHFSRIGQAGSTRRDEDCHETCRQQAQDGRRHGQRILMRSILQCRNVSLQYFEARFQTVTFGRCSAFI